jgi:isopentenyldiphosphate isomerase
MPSPVVHQAHPFSHTVEVVEAADHRLTQTTYSAISRLYAQIQQTPDPTQAVRAWSQEYGLDEFLLCVDRKGDPTPVAETTITSYRRTLALHPGYSRWFREDNGPDGEPTLLAARWLCHAVGFRHQCVELFLDHPVHCDHMILQVRGFGKAEAPGHFDLPAAGHVSGLDGIKKTLRKELREELHLALNTVDELRAVGSYDYVDPYNTEYRTIYRGRLTRDSLLTLNAYDDEVAAIVIISINEVEALLRVQPERVASGLSASFSLYQGDR